MTIYTKIIGTGSYLPERVVTNKDLEKIVDTNDEWIVSRTGISERHYAADDQNASDLALIACQRAMQAAGVTATDIDLIIVGTSTPDMVFPATANIVCDWDMTLLGAKELARAIENKQVAKKDVIFLKDLLGGAKSVDTSKRYTIYRSTGTPIQNLAVLFMVCR